MIRMEAARTTGSPAVPRREDHQRRRAVTTIARMVALPLALVLALTLALPDWYLASPSAIDPWLYHGFFRHLDLYASTLYPGTYYGTRLGWILPGHAAYALFDAETAAFVLHATFYAAAVTSLYFIVRWTAGTRQVALACAVAFGLFLPSARGLGDDYVAAGVVAYATIGTALAMASARLGHPRLLVFASGAAAAAMFHSNIVSALLMPCILIWLAPFAKDGAAWRAAGRSAAAWLAGAVACTLLLGELSVRHGGSRLFFVPSFTWMLQNSATNPWDQQGFAWVLEAPWTFVPLLTAAACAIVLLQPQRRAALDERQAKAFAAFAYIAGVFAVWDLIGSAAVLYWPFYASWLMPFSFTALGAVVLATLPPSRSDAAVLIPLAAVLLASLAAPGMRPFLFGVTGALLAVVVMLSAAVVRSRTAAAALIGLFLAHMNVWASFTGFFSPADARADVFRTVDRALALVAPFTTERQPRFLYNEKDPKLAGHYNAIAGVYLWAYSTATRSYPSLDETGAKMLRADTMAVALTERPQRRADIQRALSPYGIEAEVVSAERIPTASGDLHLTFFRTRPPEP